MECRNSTWETKEGEYEGEILELKEEREFMMLQGIYKVKEHEKEIVELKKENEELNSTLIYRDHQKKLQRNKLLEFKDEINALNEEHRKLKEQYKYL